MSRSEDVKRFADGEVYLWIEQDSSIHIKAVSGHGDPVELTDFEAVELGNTLIAMVQQLNEG